MLARRAFLAGLFASMSAPATARSFGRGPDLSLTRPAVFFGDSLTAGNISGTAYSMPSFVLSRIKGISDNEGIGSTLSGQIADRITNVDTQMVSPQWGLSRAQQLAGNVSVEEGRNNLNSVVGATGFLSTIYNDFDRSVAAIRAAGGDFVTVSPPNAGAGISADNSVVGFVIEPAGDPSWAACLAIADRLTAVYPDRMVDMKFLLQQMGDGSSADNSDLASDATPRSARLQTSGAYNALHPGPKGNYLLANNAFFPWLRACEGQGVYAMPFQRRTVATMQPYPGTLGIIASTANTLGGFVTRAPVRGLPIAFALTGGNTTDFAIDNLGRITRATSTVLTNVQDLAFTAYASNGQSSVGKLRLFFGDPTTACADTTFTGQFMVQPEAPTGQNSQAISVVAAFSTAAGTDGVSMYLLGSEKFGRLTLERNVSNRFRLILKADNTADAGYPMTDQGTSVAVLQTAATGSGLITNATGIVWVFMSINVAPATAVQSVYVNEAASVSALTATQGATASLNYRSIIAAQTQAGAAPFMGALRTLWIGAGFTDWSVASNRAAFYNPASKAAIALPANGSFTPSGGTAIIPSMWMPGNDADRFWGNNRGSLGRFVTTGLSLP